MSWITLLDISPNGKYFGRNLKNWIWETNPNIRNKIIQVNENTWTIKE